MKSAKFTLATLFFAITSVLLAACGGGGGDGDVSVAVPTAPSNPVSITGANAELISADVLYSAELLGGFALVGDLLPGLQAPLPGVQINVIRSEFNYPEFIMQQLQQLSALSLSSNDVTVSGIVISEVPTRYDCTYSGTFRIYGYVAEGAPNWIPTQGDEITITYNECDELGGIFLNGTMTIAITLLDLINDPTRMDLRVVMNVLSVGDGDVNTDDDINTDGDMQMAFREFQSGNKQLDLTGSELTVWGGDVVETLKNYAYNYSEDFLGEGVPPNYSYLMEGTLDSTVIGGSVSFLMSDPLEEFRGSGVPFEVFPVNYPYAGDLSITTNADTSSLEISVQNTDTVLIGLYSGNVLVGNITPTSSWAHLEQCLLDPGVCYGL